MAIPILSAVAGILSPDGGLRVVVTDTDSFRHHLRPGERLFIVPGLYVMEPVEIHEAGPLIQQVEDYIARRLAN